MTGILILFHCESNPGYAASSHELTFYKMALNITGDPKNIHYAYRTLENGNSPNLPKNLTQIIEFDFSSTETDYLIEIEQYIRSNDIRIVYGFDLPVKRAAYKYLRRGGVKHIISYWGAPMSSIFSGWKLLARKVQTRLSLYRPDHFIFQSEGMRLTATNGCGIPKRNTSIVKTGIDTRKYSPSSEYEHYAHDQFQIPYDRKIVFFSGHMEPRKGVAVLIETAKVLVNELGRSDIHFLILGNRQGQEERYLPQLHGTSAEAHVTFGGYRTDIPDLLRSCYAGLIPSTGWDSFPMSSVEIAATELPLVVSDLDGLKEAISSETGFHFAVGDHQEAAKHILNLIDNEPLKERLGRAGRQRVLQEFSVDSQVAGIEKIVRSVASATLR